MTTESFLPIGKPTDKVLDTTQVTQTDGTVAEREAVVLTDPDTLAARAGVSNNIPAHTSYGLITRPIMAKSQFGELKAVSRTPIIEINSAYGLSAIRDVQVTANSGTITATGGEIKLSTSATANGSALIESAEVGRYIPGYSAEIGVGIRIPTDPTGSMVARWGGQTVSESDAIYFGMDSGGLFVARRSGGTESSKTYQASWNIDPLDGTGASGVTLDAADGNVYQIEFTWYGYGQILFGILAVVGTQQTFVPCHSIRVTGSNSIQSPNLVVFAEADNGGTTTNFDVYLGGRQYSIVGKYTPKNRFTGQARAAANTSTTAIPLVTFRAKTAFRDRSYRIDGFVVKPATEDVIVELRLNGSLTGASYGTPTNHTATETGLEADVAASAISGGVVIYSDYFEAGAANKGAVSAISDLELDIPQAQPISLCVRTLSGTGTAIGFLRMKEEW